MRTWYRKEKAVASERSSAYDGNLAHAFLWPFKWLLKGSLFYIGLGVLSMTIALLLTHYYWESPTETSALLLKIEMERISLLGVNVENTYLSFLAEKVMTFTYWLFFKFTTIHDAVVAYSTGAQVNELDKLYLGQFIARNGNDIYVCMNVIQVYGIRLAILLSTLPLFVLLNLVAFTDGITERYIRRACSGRESSDINKIGKMSKLLFFAMGVTVYLCAPIPLNPFFIIIPMAIIYTVATRWQWKFYKKYL